jgi:hypothetical protein
MSFLVIAYIKMSILGVTTMAKEGMPYNVIRFERVVASYVSLEIREVLLLNVKAISEGLP